MVDKQVVRVFLLGSNISKSISPAIQNRAFSKSGFNAMYELLQVQEDKFDSTMQEIKRAKDVLGFNITAPYKERIFPYLARVDRNVKAIGAVNTVKVENGGRWSGFNTDVDGISASLKKLGAENARRCVILGAGGAARACVYTVLRNRFDTVTILNRSGDRARQVISYFEPQFPRASFESLSMTSENFACVIRDCDLLINAVTSLAEFPIKTDFSTAPKKMKLFDLGYREPSSVLKAALKSRIESLDGVLMLVEQGARSFEIWTGLEAPRNAMFLAAKRAVAKKKKMR